ncbi:MAG: bacteriohemerythrin [Candidatus Thiodiazotropha sp. (ex Epidulcina cf. delphinae)]|nr:bacteriohemerythrin [Candidatus Thiodiazotropha sp. (ex Epidulcina cf. delphinae)]
MSLITWTAEQFGTDVDFADEEHKTLFGKLNKLHELATDGADRSATGAQLDDLIAYVVEHFTHEESEMQSKGFDGYASHKSEHDALVGTGAELQKKFHAGEAEVTEEFGQLVKTWLENHIPKFDMAYSGALNG